MSVHSQEQVPPRKRDCLEEATGYHHTSIAVFSGKDDFANGGNSYQNSSSCMCETNAKVAPCIDKTVIVFCHLMRISPIHL